MRTENAFRPAGGSGGKEQHTRIGRHDSRSARFDLLFAYPGTMRQKAGPGLDTAGGRIAVERHHVAQEGVFQRHDPAGACAGDLGREFTDDGNEVLLAHSRLNEQHRTGRSCDQVVKLGRRREGAERRSDPAGQRSAEHSGNKFRPVRHQNTDLRRLACSARDKRPGDVHRAGPKIVIGPTLDQAFRTRLGDGFPRAIHPGDFANETGQCQTAKARLFFERNAAHDRDSFVGYSRIADHRLLRSRHAWCF